MIIDFHCDTISRLYEMKNEQLFDNNLQVDINKLKKVNSVAQFFALFIFNKDLPKDFINATEYCYDMLDKFYVELKDNKEYIAIARNYKELIENQKSNKISAFLTIEEGAAIGNKISNLRNFYRLGVRLITLTWNFINDIGYPSYSGKYNDKGLTEFGIQVVEEMNKLGILIDVSHLSDQGFYDVYKYSQKSFIASHSNARSVKNHTRNLTDDMIKMIAKKGGIVGINFCAAFLGNSKVSRIEDMVKHIKHIKNIGGVDVISLGTDFDGIDCDLEIKNIGEINKLFCELNKKGFTDDEIDKIAYKNAVRVIKEVL